MVSFHPWLACRRRRRDFEEAITDMVAALREYAEDGKTTFCMRPIIAITGASCSHQSEQ